MLSVLEDANSSKEVASEPFEFEELCSEDSDKVHIIIIYINMYIQSAYSLSNIFDALRRGLMKTVWVLIPPSSPQVHHQSW